MKRLLFYLIMGSLILTFSCSEDSPVLPGDDPLQHESTLKSAHKPMAKLVGYTEETLWIDFSSVPPQPYSIGTITFDDSHTFGLVYKILEMNQKENSKAMFLTETFYIFGMPEEDLTNDELVQLAMGDYLMSGTNSGVSPNGKMFVTNGEVSEAFGFFEGWAGRNVHVNGDIVSPISFTSTFRVN